MQAIDLQHRFNRNLEFFKKALPQILEHIKSAPNTLPLIYDPATSTFNYTLNEKAIYPRGARAFCKKEVNRFLENLPKPTFFEESALTFKNWPVEAPFRRTINAYQASMVAPQRENDLANKRDKFNPNFKTLLVYGLGLGFHIKELIESNEFEQIFVFEQSAQVLKSAMYTVDWVELVRSLPDKKKLTFLIPQKGHTAVDSAKRELLLAYPAFPYSLITYFHEPFISLNAQARCEINDFSVSLQVNTERPKPHIQRLVNFAHNFENNPIIDFSESKIETNGKPIGICGNGPSLDIYKDILKKNRKKIFVISAGTSLSSLLKSGIVPDLHVELEYQKNTLDILKYVNESHDISGIPLISICEAYPGYLKLFHENYLFIPQSSELSEYYPNRTILKRGGVTCTNGATALATILSNEKIILFGMDFGFKERKKHHSETSIFYDEKANLERIRELSQTFLKESIKTRSTLKTNIYTNPSFLSARYALETMILNTDHTYYNCSEGSEIKGTAYLTRAELENIMDSLNESNTHISIKHATNIDNAMDCSLDIIRQTERNIKKLVFNHQDKSPYELIKSITPGPNAKKSEVTFFNAISRVPLITLYIMLNQSNQEYHDSILNAWYEDFAEETRKLLTLFRIGLKDIDQFYSILHETNFHNK